MNARDYLEILHIAERLKDTPRHCMTSNRRTESVAEHSWRVSLMAFLLKHEFDDIDMDKVIKMCIIHDMGECFAGDIPTFEKTDSDRKNEARLLTKWIDTLPKELAEEFSMLFEEINRKKTKEAILFNALDKLEALIQHNESPIDTWSEQEMKFNKSYAFDVVKFSDWLTELRNEILDDTLKKLKTIEWE